MYGGYMSNTIFSLSNFESILHNVFTVYPTGLMYSHEDNGTRLVLL